MPVQQVVMMALVVVLVALGAYSAYGVLAPIFLANRYLNGVILGVFLIGVLACFWQVVQIASSVIWFQTFLHEGPKERRKGTLVTRAPRLLAPLAGMLGSRGAITQVSTTSARSILDSVASRMDESKDIVRYLSNLLIFLGLLGTFYGLAITVPAVIDTIRSLAPTQSEDGVELFTRLLHGLEDQLGGMGTAFSSSLIGLAGSLVVGLLELLAGHGQNRFYRELEEWISGITKVGFGQSVIEAEGSDQPLSTTTIELLINHMGGLHDQLSAVATERQELNESLLSLTNALVALGERVERQTLLEEERFQRGPGANELLEQITDNQKIVAVQLAKVVSEFSDEESRLLLRNIDILLLRLLEENINSREDLRQQLHREFSDLATSIRGPLASRKSQALGGRSDTKGAQG